MLSITHTITLIRTAARPTHSLTLSLSFSRAQVDQIWQTVQRTVVFGPLSFVYVYNILQVPNVAWQSYLQLALEVIVHRCPLHSATREYPSP